MRIPLFLFALFFVSMAMGADYEREKRWADEITPGLIVGDPVYLQTSNGHKFLNLYTEADKAKAAVIIVHGMGLHPDWGLNGVLRTRLAEQGYTTLSVQMPVLAADAKSDEYPPTFPEAEERLAAVIKYLQEKGHKKIALVSHSMSATRTNYYLKKNPSTPLFALVLVGIGSGTFEPVGAVKFPVLDLYGEKDLPQVLKNANQRAQVIKKIKGSAQIMAPKADHFFNGEDDALVKYVKSFLDKSLKRR